MNSYKNFLIIFLCLLILSKENPNIKLSGKPISSDSFTSTIKNKAFDGDISTIFESEEASKGWIGLKLDSKYLITKIGYAFPNSAKKEDYLLGIFEASNDPVFLDSTILYMITEEVKVGEMNYITIKINQRFKYIRYFGPSNRHSITSYVEIKRTLFRPEKGGRSNSTQIWEN
jgi:hypothetical protein